MTSTGRFLRFGGSIAVIILVLGYLAYTGVQESKSYYVTIADLHKMGGDAYTKHLRVAGNVVPGTIKMQGTGAEFTLKENELILQVVYKGSEPPPDTFKDNSQALAMGTLGRDGVFRATELQAKCASKYAPADGQPGAAPAAPAKPATPPKTAAAPQAPHPQQTM
jgi:cytochrome c-type biogenesis protein CcmE